MGKNFFQKIIDGLFEEVIVEEPIEDSVQEEVELPPVSNVIKSKTTEVQVKPVDSVSPKLQSEEPKKEVRSNMINIDDVKEPQIKKSSSKEVKVNQQYEFTQVISPIFGVVGNKEEKNESFVTSSTTKKKNVKTNSVLGTVISPIYGITNDNTALEQEYDSEEETLSLDDLIEKNQEMTEEVDPIHHEANFDSLVKSLEEHQGKAERKKESTLEAQNLSLFDDFDEDFHF